MLGRRPARSSAQFGGGDIKSPTFGPIAWSEASPAPLPVLDLVRNDLQAPPCLREIVRGTTALFRLSGVFTSPAECTEPAVLRQLAHVLALAPKKRFSANVGVPGAAEDFRAGSDAFFMLLEKAFARHDEGVISSVELGY